MKQIIQSFLLLITLSVLTGVVYPVFITAVAHVCFQKQAMGNLIYNSKKEVTGSYLIGQSFSSDRYFWSRPSAVGYNPLPSGGSNKTMVSKGLKETIISRQQIFRKANGISDNQDVPKEMFFSSASGLDPHISPAAALSQFDRVANARKCSSEERIGIQKLILKCLEEPQFGFLGDARVNVVQLNLSIDSLLEQKK